MIPFNKPYLTGDELARIHDAVMSGKISGNGSFTQWCHKYFMQKFGFEKVLLTTSCTDALEMSALLLDIKPGDEVIMPSYTFVSTANPFLLRGAKIRFCDSRPDHPGMDEDQIASLISDSTKAIVPVHYAGVACDMDKIGALAAKYQLSIVEDAAQAIDSYYVKGGKKKALGSFGDLAAFSFHETKNIQCGEGGLLVVNNPKYRNKSEIIWEKGTNRSAFFRGEVDKYGWVEVGSSFLPSDMLAAFLSAQLEHLEQIQDKRRAIWEQYNERLKPLENRGFLKLPKLPDYATNNAHMFYVICNSLDERSRLIAYMKANGVSAVFHYISLHKSSYFQELHDGRELPLSEYYSDHLLRLPLYYELTEADVDLICRLIHNFYV